MSELISAYINNPAGRMKRPRPKYFEPWEWCAIHMSYRRFRHVKRCMEAWGDPFTTACRFGEGSDE